MDDVSIDLDLEDDLMVLKNFLFNDFVIFKANALVDISWKEEEVDETIFAVDILLMFQMK